MDRCAFLASGCRIVAELGAKVVKTYWCEKISIKSRTAVPVPVVIAGGTDMRNRTQVFQFRL